MRQEQLITLLDSFVHETEQDNIQTIGQLVEEITSAFSELGIMRKQPS